ncbi:MAG: shikimate dehydrogenase [Rhodospirillales bacterium]|nr:shikimate dehydrogenase [Rhodospirillales bacterium]
MATSNPILCGSIAARPGRFGVAMHNAAYRALGLDHVYVAFGTEDTAGAIAAMRALGLRGLGLTMPHKVRVIDHLDALADDARAIGAVNTVVNDDGRLTGHNVDWIGAIRAFAEVGPVSGLRAAVVGAGGGARAVVFGLIRAGATVTLYARSVEQGRALAEHLGAVYAGSVAALAEADAVDLIAHVTPVGLNDASALLVPEAALRPGRIVFDAVPQPVDTRLLREAAARGCRTIPGVRMQLHQAAAQFELYTGRSPDLGVMEDALRTAMAAAGTPAATAASP